MPDAPILTTLFDGETVDRDTVLRAAHVHSDPYFEPQFAFDIRWRLIEAATWNTLYVETTNEWHDFPAGTFTAGTYERQVRTYTVAGAPGPWSPSGFFTAATAPAAPEIVNPPDGDIVDTQLLYALWASTEQHAYQLRRVADDGAGTADPTLVHFDTGVVLAPATRQLPLRFETNGRSEHLQIRVRRDDGLWSAWADSFVEVDYPRPPTPSYGLVADPPTASLLVQIANPVGEGPVEAAWNDIYVTEPVDGVLTEERRATGVPLNGSWRYWQPVSGRDYAAAVRVVAVAADGTTSLSATISGT